MQDKKTLIVIIVLLVIFLPLSVMGIYGHVTLTEDDILENQNPNHEFNYEGMLYFYSDGVLLNTYECSDCSEPATIINDTDYHTNSYLIGDDEVTPVLNSSLGIFYQNNKYVLYNLLGGMVVESYNAIKTYRVEHTNPVLIVKGSTYWGVKYLDLSSTISSKYDYVALPAHLINGKLDTSRVIAKSNLLWYVLDSSGNSVFNAVRTEITDFNDSYYVLYDNGYRVYDYEGEEYLTNISITQAYGVGEYMFIVSNGMLLVYSDCSLNPIYTATLPTYETLYFSVNDDGIAMIIDGEVTQTLVLGETE